MGEVTDPRLLSQLNGRPPAPIPMGNPLSPGGVQPMPFPGMPSVKSSTLPQQQAQERLGLDYEANARAQEASAREAARLGIAQEEAAAKARERDAKGGVTTTASEDQASGHVLMLSNSLRALKDVEKSAPEQVKPTWKEWGIAKLTGEDPTLVAAIQGPQRQVANNAYNGILESAVWMYTGAAAPVEQVDRIKTTLTPLASDTPEALQEKRRSLLALIAQARVRSGPGNIAVQQALSELENNTDLLYGKAPEASREEKVADATLSGSGDKIAIPVPEELQAEHKGFFSDPNNAPGKLSVGEYLKFRQQLQDKYNYGKMQEDFPGIEAFVKAYNEGRPISTELAPEERELGSVEGAIADAAGSEVGTFAKSYANAMGAGIPELLAGETGRVASDLADKANPKAALAGEVVGSVAPAIALEKGIAKGLTSLGTDAAGTGTRVGADLGANAAYGGVKEFNEAESGERGNAFLSGAGMGAVGAGVGRGVTKGFKEFKPKGFREGINDLGPQEIVDDTGKVIGKTRNTDLTTLQRMGATGGEEFIEGFPTVSSARQKAVASMNMQNAERALGKAGLKLPKGLNPGQETNAYIHKTLGEEYDKLGPSIKGKIDSDFNNSIAAIRNTVTAAPRRGAKPDPAKMELWQQIEDTVANFRQGGKFNYDSYKKFAGQLREWQDYWAKSTVGPDDAPSPIANEMARVADQVRQKGRELVSRANPEAGARLKRLDNAWAHKLRIEEASKGAASQESGVYAPSEYLAAIQRMDTSKMKGKIARGQGFDQPYAQSAQEVLGKKPAKTGSVLGTAAIGFSGGRAAVPIAVGVYAPGIKRLTQALTDGRLAARADGTMPKDFVAKNPWAKELPSDIVKQLMASTIREKFTKD